MERTGKNKRAHRAGLFVFLVPLCFLGPSGSLRAGPSELPNLVPIFHPATPEVFVGDEEFEAPSGRALRFGTYLLNAGSYPLEVRGIPQENELDAPQDIEEIQHPIATAPAEQCVSFNDAGACETYAGALALRWYPIYDLFLPENCYAVQGLVRYELWRLRPDRTIGIFETGRTIDHAVEDEQANGDYETTAPTYPACPALARQGLTPGWMEFRDPEHRDQYIDLSGRYGEFALKVIVDPLHRIQESNEGDNTITRLIKIVGDVVTEIEE